MYVYSKWKKYAQAGRNEILKNNNKKKNPPLGSVHPVVMPFKGSSGYFYFLILLLRSDDHCNIDV